MRMRAPTRKGLFVLTALSSSVGAILAVFALTWLIVTPEFVAHNGAMIFPKEGCTALYLGLGLLAAGIVTGVLAVATPRAPHALGSNPDRAMFGGAIVGLGLVFLVDAILNLIAFSGFAKSGLLAQVFPLIASDATGIESSNAVSAIRLIVSLGLAVLGALFFVTNSLRTKRERQRESYSERKFWAGLWFRLGEAVLFTVVFFLALRHYAPESEQLLPLIALLVGMFVTTGETLVFGLAQRVLKGAAALVATENGDARADDDADEAAKARKRIESTVSTNGHSGSLVAAHDPASGRLKKGK
jgi:hypothetical protein